MLDWDDLRFFLAIARHGSLTVASRELRVAQSTVGRRLASLETGLGVRLLHRTPDDYVLPLAGEGVRAQAERVRPRSSGWNGLLGDATRSSKALCAIAETVRAHSATLDPAGEGGTS